MLADVLEFRVDQAGKTTPISIAVRETGVSQHHEGLIEETLSDHYNTIVLKGALN